MNPANAPSTTVYRLPHRRVVAFGLLLVLVAIAALAWKAFDDHQKELVIVGGAMQLQNQALSSVFEAALESTEQTLLGLAEQVSDRGHVDPLLNLRDKLLRSPFLLDLRFYGANGMLLARGGLTPLEDRRLPDWVVRQQGQARLTGLASEREELAVFRTARAGQGPALGTFVAIFANGYFQGLAEQIPGADVEASFLLGPNNELLLDFGNSVARSGPDPVHPLVPQIAAGSEVPGTGFFEIGGYLVVVHQLRNQPIRLVQAIPKDVAFETWTAQLIHGSVMAALIVLGALIFLRQWLHSASQGEAAVAALQDMQREQQRLIKSIPVGVYKYRICASGQDRFDYVSPRLCEDLGLQAADLLRDASLAFHLYLPQDMERLIQATSAAAAADGHMIFEGRLKGDTSPPRWLRLESVLTRSDSGDQVWDGIQSDITERVRNQTEIDKQRRSLASIIEGTNVGTWEWNVQTGEAVFNARWAEIVGYTLDELAPVSIDVWAKLVHPDDMKVSSQLLESHFSGELPYYDCQARMRHKHGHWVWVQDRGRVATRTPDGKPLWMFGTHQDISEQKTIESNLQAAQQQAAAANLAKSRFLATMSHEIRTPMNGILGMAQLLLMPNLQDSQRNDYARTILSSGQSLLALLNDILDLSKIEAGKFQLEITAFAPDALLHETDNLFAGAAQAKGLQLDSQWLGAPDQRYMADAHRLRQMLSNLVGNALKFTRVGQVRMEAREIERDAGSALLEFAVIDTGIGVDEDKLDLLFKPFSQTDSSTTREFGGTGLGLSIVRQLALAMGGDVGVNSQPGQGSRFWFRVSVRTVAQVQDSRQVPRPLQNPEVGGMEVQLSGHVLVAEDNQVNCLVIESLLAQLGLKVTLVHDGQQAVDAILHTAPVAGSAPPQQADLILMDLHMPTMDGYHATRHIRQWEADQQRARVPIIALTADAFEEDRQHCLAVGMDDFLTKPIVWGALKQALARWLPAARSVSTATASVPFKAVDQTAFSDMVIELTPLLQDNKFAAISRFRALQALVHGTHLAAAVDVLDAPLQAMHFDQVLEGLRRLAIHPDLGEST